MSPHAKNYQDNFATERKGSSTRDKFNSMLLMEDYEARVQKAHAATISAVSPPSHAYQTEMSTPKKSESKATSGPSKALDKAWTR